MKKLHKLQKQKGFTLVELAIVLVIIGLLIGGILKGQQLIDNARVTAQMSQFQSLQAATTSFQDAYAALPGDLNNPANRVPNIGTCNSGNGDGVVGAQSTTANIYSTGGKGNENLCFFAELSGAGYLTGISAPNVLGFGQGLPQAKLGAGLIVADVVSGTNWSGLYIANLQSLNNPGTAQGTNAMTPSQAAQIDRKLDDGNPATGSVLGLGYASSCTGTTKINGTSVYNEKMTSKDCDLGFKIQ